jgi:hypothetical protein
MKGRKHTAEQAIRKLREGERLAAEGKNVAEVARELEISEQTYSRWRNQYGDMKADDAKELRRLRDENGRLKRVVADLTLDNQMLKEVARKLLSPSRRRDAVVHLREVFGVSERRACRVTGQQRTTQRHARRVLAPEEALRARLRGDCADVAAGRLPARLGAATQRGVAGQPQACAKALARGGASCSRQRHETPPAWHQHCSSLSPVSGAAQPRMGARLHLRRHLRRAAHQGALDVRRVHP